VEENEGTQFFSNRALPVIKSSDGMNVSAANKGKQTSANATKRKLPVFL